MVVAGPSPSLIWMVYIPLTSFRSTNISLEMFSTKLQIRYALLIFLNMKICPLSVIKHEDSPPGVSCSFIPVKNSILSEGLLAHAQWDQYLET